MWNQSANNEARDSWRGKKYSAGQLMGYKLKTV